ncbi:Ion transport protein [Emticicia oligotrophica DSM 17448]|uniref:Ion transport protein n=1 Tax=Emticicia oligotrophica (strain DSM 17448 / CIP 109782 / MTCC 6937 / GPTSA100-15) TaxID=929562 RepID=A0ABM5MWW3_EMTOG|nr:ion transporter [Emticicia oligotrophica]AFK01630.1 Ion transport protein [Emticicia oligotrophica DSM 17448]
MTKKAPLRKKIHGILEITWHQKLGLSFWINIFLTVIISLNAVAIIIDTVPSIHKKYHSLLVDFEVFSVVVFTIEYILRLWSCVDDPHFSHPVKGRIKFIFSAWGLVDLLSILPFYASFFLTDLGFIRILRLLRMLRLFRVSKYFHALKIIQKVIKEKQEELILSFVFIIFVLIISSSTLYYFEHETQPRKFSSIPETMWWCVNAMTTVGDADYRPITPIGKIIGGIISILGVALFALPTGILASGFAEQIRRQKPSIKCPHCGNEFNHTH